MIGTTSVSPEVAAVFKSAAEQMQRARRELTAASANADAAAWLEYGLSLQVATPLDAVQPLLQAVALGSDEAMTWLGLTLIEIAPLGDDAEAATLILSGVGWLETAMMAGEYHARAWFPEALRNLTPELLAQWHALPPHSQTVVN